MIEFGKLTNKEFFKRLKRHSLLQLFKLLFFGKLKGLSEHVLLSVDDPCQKGNIEMQFEYKKQIIFLTITKNFDLNTIIDVETGAKIIK